MILLEGDLIMDDMSKVFQGLPAGCPTQPNRMQSEKCRVQSGGKGKAARMQSAKCKIQNGTKESGYMANRMGGTGGGGESGECRLQN